MAERKTLARPYVKAIFELATGEGHYEGWSSMLSVLTMVVENSGVVKLLKDTRISVGKMEVFFLDVCGSYLNEQGKNFVRMLAVQRQLALIPFIAKLYEELRKEAEHTMDVNLVSAVPLSAVQETQFSSFLNERFKKVVKLNTKVDPTLKGGFRATIGDIVIDGSIKGRLEQLKKMMGGNNGD
jgi:F-type H+-transporting ATPase subunit delta